MSEKNQGKVREFFVVDDKWQPYHTTLIAQNWKVNYAHPMVISFICSKHHCFIN